MKLRSAAAPILLTGLLALPAAAGPGAVLAAPGDCAQPISETVTPPVYGQSAGVGGPASDHFAPRGATGNAVGLLPLELTRVRVDPAGSVTGVVNGVAETVGGTVAVDGTVGAVGAVAENVGPAALGAAEGVTDGVGTATGAVSAAGNDLTESAAGTMQTITSDPIGSAGDAGSLAGGTISGATGDVGALGGGAIGAATGTLGAVGGAASSLLGGRQ